MEYVGLGTVFERYNGTTWERVAQVASIQPPQSETEVVEVDDLDPPDGIKKKIPGVIDAGELSLTLNFDPADNGHTALEADHYARAINQYRIKLPNGKGWTITGFISGWAPQEIGESDVIQVEVTITVTAKATLGDITP